MPCLGGCPSGWGGCRAEGWGEDLWPTRLQRAEVFVDSFNDQAKEDWLFPRTGHPWKFGAREYKGCRGILAVPRRGRTADLHSEPPAPAQSAVGTNRRSSSHRDLLTSDWWPTAMLWVSWNSCPLRTSVQKSSKGLIYFLFSRAHSDQRL